MLECLKLRLPSFSTLCIFFSIHVHFLCCALPIYNDHSHVNWSTLVKYTPKTIFFINMKSDVSHGCACMTIITFSLLQIPIHFNNFSEQPAQYPDHLH